MCFGNHMLAQAWHEKEEEQELAGTSVEVDQ